MQLANSQENEAGVDGDPMLGWKVVQSAGPIEMRSMGKLLFVRICS